MTKDSDLRRKMQEEEAERDRRWDAAHDREDHGHYDRLVNDQQQRVALACNLLRSGQSGPEVERVVLSTLLSDPLMPVTQSLADKAAGIVDMARFFMGATLPSGWTPFEPDPRPHPDHPEQEDDEDV